ncbi:mechanosensitive ion channel [Flammeovirga yaeyamensis]|uniref:Mechanosensitive ion channel n=1 Tax=Flammeovirga yaeyamensis TaxID=367791 RepID=A0AAX1N907_9BACT|nr:mechanosensitive ion channel family protein [Flammeovirga yaeyamensis]MBB3700434.1 MscS family membrane protein [Flammeovirga yaeyamensis]NMF36942.1 mechanosensitive ion channel [Flammeovirga yaeyamensis]QWG02512.1 mechanosensitive ion channel [Flammeovirga yaeyamensis]
MNRFFTYIYIFLVASVSVYAQSDSTIQEQSYPDDHSFYNFKNLDSVEYSLNTPYHAFHTHLNNLEESSFHPKVSAQVFPSNVGSLEERKELAIELKLIYLANNIYVNNIDLPLTKKYIDPKTKSRRFQISDKIPNIYLEYQNGQWRYSTYSCQSIHQLFKDTYPSFARELVLYTSNLQRTQGKFLNLKVWQWISIFSLLVLTYLYYFFSVWFTEKVLSRLLLKAKQEQLAKIIVPKLRRPIAWLSILAFGLVAIPFLLLPSGFSYVATILVKLGLGINFAVLFFEFADILVLRIGIFSKKSKKVDENLIPILKVIFRIVAISLGILMVLQILGYDITHLVTGISFGGVAIAFAAQDTIKNFIGSVMIFADRPFEVGDWVIVRGQEGIVEEIGFRTSRIRTFANSILNIPNGSLADSDIDNLGKRQYRRFKTNLAIPYGTPPDKIEMFIKAIKKAVEEHPQTRKDFYEVRLNNFSSSSLDILLYIFFITKDWSEELQAREYLMLKILRIAQQMGIDFAFPTQTIHLAQNDNMLIDD